MAKNTEFDVDARFTSPSKTRVLKRQPMAEVRRDGFMYYVVDTRTGKALSPYCPGVGPAWRWAEIHVTHFGVLDV